MHTLSASLLGIALAVTTLTAGGQRKPTDVPVDFSANIQVVGDLGAAATSMRVHIDKYTTDSDRTTLLNALRKNGYQAFLPAFRKLAAVGYVEIKAQKWDLRWAQQQPRELGQVITAATDQPIYFVGGGNVDAKPRAGFEMAVIRFEVDTIGMGSRHNGSRCANQADRRRHERRSRRLWKRPAQDHDRTANLLIPEFPCIDNRGAAFRRPGTGRYARLRAPDVEDVVAPGWQVEI